MDAPKMSRKQAKILWNSLSWEQKAQFNDMYGELLKGKLTLNHVGVDDNEQIQRIVLEPKEKPSAPAKPFYDHFK
jgi:hypothetical protein